ncbi:MAG TPA: divergent polysaccharide deacetylase family protein [Rhizomicrobium sp.]|nr:divergent polysaccharide deacetylase family protein [Rhizomicrobium sp.]
MTDGHSRWTLLLIAWAILLLALGGAAAWIAVFGNPGAAGPVVSFNLGAPAQKRAARPKPPTQAANTNLIGAGPQPAAPMPPPAGAAPPAAQTPPSATPTLQTPNFPPVTLPPQLVPGQVNKAVYAGRALIADPALIEQTSQGPLPRIADDGRTPMAAYAPPSGAAPGQPRIAIVVSGLGISARQTQAAIAQLPPQITLAFAPYDSDVQRWIGEARRQGHEVLMEVPMEPYDFPDSDPGPHTLRAAAGESTNIQRLTWSLSRATGFAGITNLLGGRFLTDSDSLEPVMTFLARRGLLFFDNGEVPHSVAPDVAKSVNAPFVQASTEIDAIQAGMEIDQRLSELEARARLNGWAAGSGFLYPVTVDRLTVWAKGLSGRGIALVPASAIVVPSK